MNKIDIYYLNDEQREEFFRELYLYGILFIKRNEHVEIYEGSDFDKALFLYKKVSIEVK